MSTLGKALMERDRKREQEKRRARVNVRNGPGGGIKTKGCA